MAPASGAVRQARLRARGLAIGVVLRDEMAIANLEALKVAHGGVTAAITHALRECGSHSKECVDSTLAKR